MAKDLDIGPALRALGAGDWRSEEVGAKAEALNAALRGGAPVPAGFVLSASAFACLMSDPESVRSEVETAIATLERETGRRLGDPDKPLLLAARLSPESWLPDLTPALLGLGAARVDGRFDLPAPWPFGDEGEGALLRGLCRFALDLSQDEIDDALEASESPEIDALRQLAFGAGAGDSSAFDLVFAALSGMAAAWGQKRARRRRAAAGASDRCALLVQAMPVAEQAGQVCGSGALTLYDAESGAQRLSGSWSAADGTSLSFSEDDAPPDMGDAVRDALVEACLTADAALRGPRELSFVLVDGAPWIVGARPLRASAQAHVRIEVSLAQRGVISREEALRRIDPLRLEEMLHRRLDPEAPRVLIAQGLPASPGAAAGVLALSADEAERRAHAGESVVLICEETSPEDVHALHAAAAVMTTRGGLTSHAAVVARGLDKPCVVGAAEVRIDPARRVLISPDGTEHAEGAPVTIDGSTGAALVGELPIRAPELTGDFATLMSWADQTRRLRVRANADTPADAETARRLGVDGIGLCRTEHMFVDKARITVMREMILADAEADRRAALDRLLPMQRADFARLFEIMGRENGREARPVTIRLLDPPLHEFMPQTERGLRDLAEAMGQPADKVARRAAELREFNPMLGKRGCRMGVAFPEIYEMQARAIFEAAVEVEMRTGAPQRPEIMIPLVSAVREIELLCDRIDAVAAAVKAEREAAFSYQVGIMVETPRAALRADALGAASAFFSFGTNDLTQMTYGLSRDDAGRLMRDYVERGVFEADPFQSLDQEGVGELIRMAVERGRGANPDLTIGLCGEHGGDPATIAFCETAGFDYVSCSPFRAPIARLAAAQAAIAAKTADSAADPGVDAAADADAAAEPARSSS